MSGTAFGTVPDWPNFIAGKKAAAKMIQASTLGGIDFGRQIITNRRSWNWKALRPIKSWPIVRRTRFFAKLRVFIFHHHTYGVFNSQCCSSLLGFRQMNWHSEIQSLPVNSIFLRALEKGRSDESSENVVPNRAKRSSWGKGLRG